MSDTKERRRIRSRSSRAPIKNADGSFAAVQEHMLTASDNAMLKSLAQYGVLSADYLAALNGLNYQDWTRSRTTILSSPPYAWIEQIDEQLDPLTSGLHLNVKRQFRLTKLGKQHMLDEFGIVVPDQRLHNSRHDILSCHAMASFGVGARESGERFKLMLAPALMKSAKMPEATKAAAFPFHIPIGDQIKNSGGKLVPHVVELDSKPFVIEDTLNGLFYFCPGFEVGTGAETHVPKEYRHDHSLTYSKFEDSITILEKEIYASHFGANNCFFIFLEPSWHRIDNMLARLKSMTERKRWARPSFLFKARPFFTQRYVADGDMLTGEYRIVNEDGSLGTFSFMQ